MARSRAVSSTMGLVSRLCALQESREGRRCPRRPAPSMDLDSPDWSVRMTDRWAGASEQAEHVERGCLALARTSRGHIAAASGWSAGYAGEVRDVPAPATTECRLTRAQVS